MISDSEGYTPDPPSVTGYMHPLYARAHGAFGTPRELPRCKGWVIERAIPGFADVDAMGCYPLFSCQDWSQLHVDIADLGDELVSLTMVTDPFGDYDEAYLRRCFPDLAIPFKEHFVIDLAKDPYEYVSRHHRKEARRALRKVTVEEHPEPIRFLDEWFDLYGNIVKRHDITGIRAFTREAFEVHLSLPGATILRVLHEGKTVGAQLWLTHGEVAYGHVLAFNDVGYKLGANYALHWFAIEHLAKRVRWLNLAGVAGATDGADKNLAWFKRGWTQETRTAWLCGVVLNRRRYAEVVGKTLTEEVRYFPAYRAGEMT